MSQTNPRSSFVNAMIRQFPNEAATTPTVDAASKTLAERPHALPDVHDILVGLLGLCTAELQLRISEALTESEKQLVRLAEKATMDQQDRCFDSVRELRCSRADVVPRFLRRIEHSLACLGEQGVDLAQSCGSQVAKAMQYRLTITEEAQLDESVVLDDIANRVEQRIPEPLYALGQRLAELAGTPRIATEMMPLGPRAITDALRFATSTVELVLDHRLLLYRCFERVVMKEIGSLYTTLNGYLAGQGILPDLHAILTSSGPDDAEHAQSVSMPAHTATARSRHPSRVSSIPRAASPLPASRAPTGDSLRPSAIADNGRDHDQFAALRQLLKECRQAEAHTVNSEDLQRALATLQADHNAMASAGSHLVRSGEEIKQAVLMLLREHIEYGRMPRIGDADSDTIELVAMLFEYLSRRARPDGLAAWVLAKFQIPILRVALKDKRFFSDKAHPARQLLSDSVEAGIFWVDEIGGERDAALVDKMHRIADRVAHDSQGNVLMFVDAREELSRYLETLARRSEDVEQRHVDVARDAERLERSRLLAAAAIRERIASRKPCEFMRMLLEHGWMDALVATLLRDGEGDNYRRRLEIVDLLLDSEINRVEPHAPLPPNMRLEIENGLRQGGMHDDDIRSTIQKLVAHADDENPISQTELAIKLKRNGRLGEGKISLPVRSVPAADGRSGPSGLATQAALARLQALPPGTWLEFSVNQRGDTVRRKLLWHSTHTGRCLLTNRWAVPAELQTLEELAREIVGERARVVDADEKPLIDRAWEGISEALSNFSPRKGNFASLGSARNRRSFEDTRDESPPQQERRSLLLVDDEENILRALTRVFRDDGYQILTATSATRALEILSQQDIQVVISDQRMPTVSGTEFLTKIKAIYPNTIRIMLSGYSDAATVTDAINRGVIYKFLTKPWDDDDIRLQVREAFRAWELR